MVECTRLQEASRALGDSRTGGLQFHATVPIMLGNQRLGNLNVATDEWQLFNASDLQLLSAFGVQIAAMLDRAHMYEEANAQRKRMENRLKMARALQVNLLPSRLPESPASTWRRAGIRRAR